MTSASGLFYNWRSRTGAGRDADPCPGPGLGLDSPYLDRGRRRRRPDGCDPSQAGQQEPRRRPLHTEHESFLSDQNDSNRSRTGNSNNGVIGSSSVSRLRLNGQDQLPSAVVLARARLLERLRAISLTGSRQTTVASSIPWEESSARDDFSIIGSRGLELGNLRQRVESSITFADLAIEANRTSSRNANKKPPGLSSETISTLQQEVFKPADRVNEILRSSQECCICLELFLEGDRLTWLQCGHRFHQSCLEPWVLACGDCPYCRAAI